MIVFLAQSTDPIDWSTGVSALGTGGILFCLLWWFLTKHLPMVESRHREERDQLHTDLMQMMSENSTHQEEIKVQLKSIDENIKGLRDDVKP